MSGKGWDVPQFLPQKIVGISISSATIGAVLPVSNYVVARSDSVVAIYSVRLHELILQDFLGEGELLD
jgi:hypothetical protein